MKGDGDRSILISGLLCCLVLSSAVASDDAVTLECWADFYAPGEPVLSTWTNNTDSTVVAGNHPPYDIYRVDDGGLICQVTLPSIFTLGSHASALLSWDQRDCNGDLVSPGAYLIRIYYAFNDAPPVFMVQDAFQILSPASAPDDSPMVRKSSWGEVRMAFR
jgi:hypothetical protein